MNTTVQALRSLYLKLGGSLTDTYTDIANGIAVVDYATIPDMVDAVTKKAGGGGTSLPSVSSSDNGDVLTVVNGAWAKSAPASSEAMLVTFTASDGTYSADKTLAEINTEWGNSKNIIGYNSETGYVLPCVLCNSDVAIFSATALTAASTYTAMSMQVTASSGLVYEQANVELASGG